MSERVDRVYVAASAGDARLTRICVASLRHFHPGVPISILPGSSLQPGLRDELQRRWSDVSVAAIEPGSYGWGFVKLEPLFLPPGERFLVLDSDTVLTGPVLDLWSGDAAFLVDDERQSAADTRRLYYDWQRLVAIDAGARPPQFVFNSGQWFGTSGLLTRDDFAPWVDWTFPRRLRHPEYFMPGDQGVLNYVLNRMAARGQVSVQRRKIMQWPGHGMAGISAATVTARRGPALVVHWAGCKRVSLRAMPGADLLQLFEKLHYDQVPGGAVLRPGRAARLCAGAVLDRLAARPRRMARRLRATARRAWSGQRQVT